MSFDRKPYMKQWFLNHKDDQEFTKKRLEANARWRNNPKRREEARRRVAEWRRRNPDYAKAYIKKNKARLRKYNSEFSKKHPERARAYTQKRRAIIRNAAAENCADAIKSLMRKSNCYWCTQPFDLIRRVHIDHVIPISRGGKHIVSNLVASCFSCNNSKRDKFYWEWDGELAS